MWARIIAAPWFIYIKLVFIALLVAGAAWLSWTVKANFDEKDKADAVNAAVKDIKEQLRVEQEQREHWKGLATQTNKAILDQLKSISNASGEIRKSVAKERAGNPKFYDQKLPDGGYTQWMKARALVVSPAASAASSP